MSGEERQSDSDSDIDEYGTGNTGGGTRNGNGAGNGGYDDIHRVHAAAAAAANAVPLHGDAEESKQGASARAASSDYLSSTSNGGVIYPKVIELNVGGRVFATSLQTLNKDPTSMLAAMFSGRIGLARDKVGRFFVDRDGRYFHLILNYLRDGTCTIPPSSHAFQELRREAEFFRLESLLEYLAPGCKNMDMMDVSPDSLRRTALEARRENVQQSVYQQVREYVLKECTKAARCGRQRWEKTVRIGSPNYDAVQQAGSLVIDDLSGEGFMASFEPCSKGQSYRLAVDIY